MFELEKNELAQLNNIIRKDEEDNNIGDEENEIINVILAVELIEEEKSKSKKIELSEEEEEKIATQKLQRDEKELSSEKRSKDWTISEN